MTEHRAIISAWQEQESGAGAAKSAYCECSCGEKFESAGGSLGKNCFEDRWGDVKRYWICCPFNPENERPVFLCEEHEDCKADDALGDACRRDTVRFVDARLEAGEAPCP